MSDRLAEDAFTALTSGDKKWKRLHVSCEANRLLAVFFWLLTEQQGTTGRTLNVYSKALRSVINEKKPVVTIEDLYNLKNIGPHLSKMVVEHLWRLHPPEMPSQGQAPQAAVSAPPVEETRTSREEKKSRKARSKKEYIPPAGTSNYAFLIVLLEAAENDEKFISKHELMARTEKSGLCDSCVYGNDPLVTRRRKEFDVVSQQMLSYTAWSCTTTLLRQTPPLVEIFGRPKKVTLTPSGIELAKRLREHALESGRMKPKESTEEPQTIPPSGSLVDCASGDFDQEMNEIVDPAATERIRKTFHHEHVAIRETTMALLPYTDPRASFDDEFELILVIDHREHFVRQQNQIDRTRRQHSLESHLTLFQNLGVTVTVRQLLLGDALWVARKRPSFPDGGEEYVLDWIVERKRVDDLAASIIDRRYEQQKYWLRRCRIANIIYLVEGDPSTVERSHAVRTATVATEALDGFRVVRTKNYRETLQFYVNLSAALKQRLDNPYANALGIAAQRMSVLETHLVSLRQLTHRKVWGLMLTRIPGIGPDTALAICKYFPTPQSLHRKHAEVGTEILTDTLADIRIIDSSRRIGLQRARKICTALFR